MGGAVEEILLERRHKWDSKVKKKNASRQLKKKKWLKKATAIYFLVYIVEISKS